MLIPLSEATSAAGAKAATLGALIRAGFPVPAGFVVGPHATQGAAELTGELGEALAALGDGPVAVRSSAAGEDSAEASAAGQYDSFLGVRGLPAVLAKIQATLASVRSPRATAYRGSQSAEPRMAVIVQRHVDADVAGVLFTPGSPTSDTVIEASWGLGESVVQGLVTPDSYQVGHAVIRRLGDKRTRVDRGDSGTITTEVPPDDRLRHCLTDAQLQELHRLGQQVAAHLGGPQDLEFAVDQDQLWLLQSRPVTASLPDLPDLPDLRVSTRTSHARDSPVPDRGAPEQGQDTPTRRLVVPGRDRGLPEQGQDTPTRRLVVPGHQTGAPMVLHGTPGSGGIASGPARMVRGPEDFHRVRAGDVLVCRFTDPAWTPLFGVAAAVVTEVGGQLSHAAIVARERRIPAVLGIDGVLSLLDDDRPTTVDGTAGTVARD